MKNIKLFVYGSLCDEVLRQQILRHPVVAQPARLPGFRAFYLNRQPYPALRRVPTAITRGWLLSDLDEIDIRRLDRYEGFQYMRRLHKIYVGFTGRSAWVYVLRPRYRRCLGNKCFIFQPNEGRWPSS